MVKQNKTDASDVQVRRQAYIGMMIQHLIAIKNLSETMKNVEKNMEIVTLMARSEGFQVTQMFHEAKEQAGLNE
jgi:methylphosphotriester-DNA--protein-cysteine methyltransferase